VKKNQKTAGRRGWFFDLHYIGDV